MAKSNNNFLKFGCARKQQNTRTTNGKKVNSFYRSFKIY